MSNKVPKKRAVISYANMFPELAEAFKVKYPKGYADYMGDIFKVEKPDGSYFHAVSVEILDAIYLVKIVVREDDYDDVNKDLFNDNSEGDSSENSEEGFPDDGANDSSFSDDDN